MFRHRFSLYFPRQITKTATPHACLKYINKAKKITRCPPAWCEWYLQPQLLYSSGSKTKQKKIQILYFIITQAVAFSKKENKTAVMNEALIRNEWVESLVVPLEGAFKLSVTCPPTRQLFWGANKWMIYAYIHCIMFLMYQVFHINSQYSVA